MDPQRAPPGSRELRVSSFRRQDIAELCGGKRDLVLSPNDFQSTRVVAVAVVMMLLILRATGRKAIQRLQQRPDVSFCRRIRDFVVILTRLSAARWLEARLTKSLM